jgi:hypothetical protein
LWVKRLARCVGAGGSGMSEGPLEGEKFWRRKIKSRLEAKAAFITGREGAEFQRHEFIMHEPKDKTSCFGSSD